MSTTVTYKGSTLTTVDNQTRTLKTAGKYMEGDVILTDVTESGGGGYVWQDENGYVHLSDEGDIVSIEPLSVTQNGTYTATTRHAYSPVTVNVSSGGGPVQKKQVNFIDYDGTILYSYTKTETNALTSLPSNPSHTGLTAQGWNWTLQQIKAQLTAMPDGDIWVGQMYITSSGDTEIDVSFADSTRLSPILTIAVNGTITVDWGDNTTADTLTGTSLTTRKTPQHTYSSVGDYTITIHVVSGSFQFYGSANYLLLRKNATQVQNRIYANCVKAVRFGSGVTSIDEYSFIYCTSLTSVTMPSTITTIGRYVFRYCYSLASVTIPSVVTSISTYLFADCESLASVAIPGGATSINSNAFQNCHSLKGVTIPSGVTNINSSVFSSCYSLISVTMPSGVTSIGDSAFGSCYALASVAIPSGVTSIGASAFANCYSIASATVPSAVTSIGNSVFSSCNGVAEYHIKPTDVPTFGTNVFNGIVSDCVIYVPSAKLDDYKTASNWSTYASYMQGE